MRQLYRSLSHTSILVVLALSLLTISGTALSSVIGANIVETTPIISSGNTASYYAPHHSGAGHPGTPDTHFFSETGDAHHFAWNSVTPGTAGTLVVNYDFRAAGAFANLITVDQQNRALDAMDAWSAATGGKLTFSQNTTAFASQIINIGTGDLAAFGSTSGVGGVLGLGGGSFSHNNTNSTHSISGGIAWQDSADNWDTTIGNGNVAGTFDYFTVVAQEIGHALGLGHISSTGMMNGGYTGELAGLFGTDINHITSIYGVAAVPIPAGIWLLATGLVWLFGTFRTRRQTSVVTGQLVAA